MFTVNDEDFNMIIAQVMKELPPHHIGKVKNVAILWDDEPSHEQRVVAKLRYDQTLFGLYQGVPLTQRMGRTDFPPDIITIFRGPISRSVDSKAGLKERVKHTIWHEIAHYFGLNHRQIQDLE